MRLVAALLVGGLAAEGAAQTPDTAPPAAQEPAAQEPAAQEPAARAPAAKAPLAGLRKLTSTEIVYLAAKKVAVLAGTVADLAQQMEIARKEKDIIKLNCLVDRHGRMRRLLDLSEDGLHRMRDEAPRAHIDETVRGYGEILVLLHKADAIAIEAAQCTGGSDLHSVTIIDVERPKPKVGEFGPEYVVPVREMIRPPSSSPWR